MAFALGDAGSLATYFALARGRRAMPGAQSLPALEMTKWFDTNYHYLVPQLTRGQEFRLAGNKPIDEFVEARALGILTRPVLLGPVTFLRLCKADGIDPLSLVPGLLPVYPEVLRGLAAAGAEWVQLDEPILALDLEEGALAAIDTAYATLSAAAPGLRLLLATYFGGLGPHRARVLRLPVAGLHLDLVRAPEQIDVAQAAPRALVLSLGLVDGRNVWRLNLQAILERLRPVAESGHELILAPSCSLLHVPLDLEAETDIEPELRGWLAFATQKLDELVILRRALTGGGGEDVARAVAASGEAARARARSKKIHDPNVARRVAAVTPDMRERRSPFRRQRDAQRLQIKLPAYPTTMIGSFPQTAEVRKARSEHAHGTLSDAAYGDFLRRETAAAVRWQEDAGIDVLVHGEFERTTWCSTSANNSPATPSPSTAGYKATACAACGRRSSTATSRGRTR